MPPAPLGWYSLKIFITIYISTIFPLYFFLIKTIFQIFVRPLLEFHTNMSINKLQYNFNVFFVPHVFRSNSMITLKHILYNRHFLNYTFKHTQRNTYLEIQTLQHASCNTLCRIHKSTSTVTRTICNTNFVTYFLFQQTHVTFSKLLRSIVQCQKGQR